MHKEYIVGWTPEPFKPMQMFQRPEIFNNMVAAEAYGRRCTKIWGGAFLIYELKATVGPFGTVRTD